MNILIFNWRDIKHPKSGGAELSLLEHAKYWRKQKAEVTWFTSNFKHGKDEEVYDGIKFIRRGSQFTVHIHAFIYYVAQLKEKTDVVIDNFHGLPFFTPLYISRKKIVALINEPAKEVWFKNIFWPLSLIAYHIEPLFFLLYKKIPFITSAKSIFTELVNLGIAKRDIYVIRHGISVMKIRDIKREKEPVIMYLSQISKDKGIEDALVAYSMVKKNIQTVKFWIVGKSVDEKYGRYIRKIVKKKKLHDVNFFGYVDNRKKFELLQKAWLLVHPSIREGWGLNVIEANACGIPAVGYNVTGLRDSIVHTKTGILTQKNIPDELAKQLTYLLSHKDVYKTMSKNAVAWSKQFHWNASGEESWNLVKKVYAKKS